ncbi:MAG: cupredoxin domain-containing protein [Thermodesulfobacteriota bacterium]
MKHVFKSLCCLFTFCFMSFLTFAAQEESKPFEAQLSEDGIQRVEVIVDTYLFNPNQIIVAVNKPVEITLKSVTTLVPHNFTLNYPEAGLSIDQDISSGEEAKITFTPTKTGNFEFHCNKKGLFGSHLKKGMKGVLEVRG